MQQANETCLKGVGGGGGGGVAAGGGGGGGGQAANKLHNVEGCTYKEGQESSHKGGQGQVHDSGYKAL